ncbi:cyanophycin synthetase, partial [Mycolicibacterium elephantis]
IPLAGPIGVLDALGAAALARAVDVPAGAIAAALSGFEVGRHRAEVVATVDGVTYVDDSKATNPHAAQASIAAYPRVVWIAGGLLKGASVEGLVASVADRLVGAVLIGRDREFIANALSRHAPNVPVVTPVTGEDFGMLGANGTDETGRAVMSAVVAAARDLATPGDTVLLAPAGASFDQFSSYGHRGDAFAEAVRALSR